MFLAVAYDYAVEVFEQRARNGDDKARREYQQWHETFAPERNGPRPRPPRLDLAAHRHEVAGPMWEAAASSLRICVQQVTGETVEPSHLTRFMDNDANVEAMMQSMAAGW